MGSFTLRVFTLKPFPVPSTKGALTNSLLFRANSTCKVLEHLVCSNTSGFQFWGPLARTNFLSALCGLPKKGYLSDTCATPYEKKAKITRPQLGPFFVLKFVRSQGLGARFLQPFPKSLVTVKAYSNTELAINSR